MLCLFVYPLNRTIHLSDPQTSYCVKKTFMAGATRVDRKAEQNAALENIRAGLATKVRILANRDCCPYCQATEGVYDLNNVPQLPHEECSHPDGCRCFYAPVLDYFGP